MTQPIWGGRLALTRLPVSADTVVSARAVVIFFEKTSRWAPFTMHFWPLEVGPTPENHPINTPYHQFFPHFTHYIHTSSSLLSFFQIQPNSFISFSQELSPFTTNLHPSSRKSSPLHTLDTPPVISLFKSLFFQILVLLLLCAETICLDVAKKPKMWENHLVPNKEQGGHRTSTTLCSRARSIRKGTRFIQKRNSPLRGICAMAHCRNWACKQKYTACSTP